MAAFLMLMALSFGAIILRHVTFMGIVSLTLKMMSDIAAAAFHHIQRFSSDWHATASPVRRSAR